MYHTCTQQYKKVTRNQKKRYEMFALIIIFQCLCSTRNTGEVDWIQFSEWKEQLARTNNNGDLLGKKSTCTGAISTVWAKRIVSPLLRTDTCTRTDAGTTRRCLVEKTPPDATLVHTTRTTSRSKNDCKERINSTPTSRIIEETERLRSASKKQNPKTRS